MFSENFSLVFVVVDGLCHVHLVFVDTAVTRVCHGTHCRIPPGFYRCKHHKPGGGKHEHDYLVKRLPTYARKERLELFLHSWTQHTDGDGLTYKMWDEAKSRKLVAEHLEKTDVGRKSVSHDGCNLDSASYTVSEPVFPDIPFHSPRLFEESLLPEPGESSQQWARGRDSRHSSYHTHFTNIPVASIICLSC